MKRIKILIIGVAVIAIVTFFGINISSRGNSFPDLALANIEALAEGETLCEAHVDGARKVQVLSVR